MMVIVAVMRDKGRFRGGQRCSRRCDKVVGEGEGEVIPASRVVQRTIECAAAVVLRRGFAQTAGAVGRRRLTAAAAAAMRRS